MNVKVVERKVFEFLSEENIQKPFKFLNILKFLKIIPKMVA